MADLMTKVREFVNTLFKVSVKDFIIAIKTSYSVQGYIYGAISELLLKKYLEENGFETRRIKEKPKGGKKGKSTEARGDFFIRKKSDKKWYVIECKGLKSNSEFAKQIADLTTRENLKRFLKHHALLGHGLEEYERGKRRYENVKTEWERKHRGEKFPPFRWKKDKPGKCNCSLKRSGIWKGEKELNEWIERINDSDITEEKYRAGKGPVIVLATHAPINRTSPLTEIKQAAPLVDEFSIMAVDLFMKTGEHKFVFMNPLEINHSPTSPDHLYQNYVIDIIVPGEKDEITLNPPWYEDIRACINETKPRGREMDKSQLNNRIDRLIEETESEL